ncbi:aldehyde oxidase GLOX-like [Curcuma longa]|uniref:aldehyde oxidase GLOX-like n=1 Tax=Curcuma longa TaxID=136217 RepID=UPI003D9F1C01
MRSSNQRRCCIFFLLLLPFLSPANGCACGGGGGGGQWKVLQPSIGVSAMHMQLLPNDRVVIFDRTDSGPSNLSLPGCRFRGGSNKKALRRDCTSHSVEYDVAADSFRPLTVLTDTWCSSGSLAPDGALLQTGGYSSGERAARTFHPCDDYTCDWEEHPKALAVRRWYASNQVLPDGRAIVVGGRRQFSYEFFPKQSKSDSAAVYFRFLVETKDAVENNLYPFVHLNIDGNLFVFANNRAVLLDYVKNRVVRKYPPIPGAEPRNYPSSGSSVLLPLAPTPTEAEVLVCGGAPLGAYLDAKMRRKFRRALDTCGRIKITDAAAEWTMEAMPGPRVMGDMVLLPSGDVLLVNGAAVGTSGWELARSPVQTPAVYRPASPAGARFEEQSAASTARLYHSSAVLLRDGSVLVGGSNPHVNYSFYGVEFPTELSLDVFSPAYLSAGNAEFRPRITSPASSPLRLSYGERFTLEYEVATPIEEVKVTMVAPAFTTHSFSMNQRALFLETAEKEGGILEAVAPESGKVAPPGFYMVFVVNGHVPSEGVWARIG